MLKNKEKSPMLLTRPKSMLTTFFTAPNKTWVHLLNHGQKLPQQWQLGLLQEPADADLTPWELQKRSLSSYSPQGGDHSLGF